MKFEISTFLPVWRNLTIFCWAELETTIQILLKLFTAPHCQERKLLCQFFAQVIYRENQPMKFEILIFSLARRKFTHFLCWIGNQGQETAVSIFCSGNFLLDKSNQWNLKFWPSYLLEEYSPNFFMLKWGPGFRFFWNFPQLFTVRTGNCCVNFLLS